MEGYSNVFKTFVYTSVVMINQYTYVAPCLNGGEHKWKKQVSYPKQNKMICEYCGEIKSNN